MFSLSVSLLLSRSKVYIKMKDSVICSLVSRFFTITFMYKYKYKLAVAKYGGVSFTSKC